MFLTTIDFSSIEKKDDSFKSNKSFYGGATISTVYV